MCLGEVATVVAVDVAAGTATIRAAGRERVVSMAVRPDVRVGDRVMVHTGFIVDLLDRPPDVTSPDPDTGGDQG